VLDRGAVAKLLKIEDLRVQFRTHAGSVKAVDGISYGVEQGETVALVGESGCGKSMSALAVMGLVPSPGRTSGSVWFQGVDLLRLREDQLRDVRGRDIAMVFQEPMTSLNPVLTIQTQLVEGMRRHLGLSKASAGQRATHLLRLVGIAEPEHRLKQYPHHFSGGMRQRVMIAMALSCNPKLIIADEPTTALDVTIQAQILELIKELTQRLGVALVLITHNLGAVARYADRVNVMYAGRLVETAPTAELYARPRHPYTIGLMNSVPRMTTQRGARLIPIEGLPPDLSCLDGACAYRPRCRWAIARCAEAFPPLEPVGPDHRSACFRSHEL
jgi:oligopeptide/dipeptide ABC transporter ATP-binding protein